MIPTAKISQKHCDTNGRRIARWEAYRDTNGRSADSISLSSGLRSTESTAIQTGGVLQYFLRSSGPLVFGVSDILLI